MPDTSSPLTPTQAAAVIGSMAQTLRAEAEALGGQQRVPAPLVPFHRHSKGWRNLVRTHLSVMGLSPTSLSNSATNSKVSTTSFWASSWRTFPCCLPFDPRS